MKKQILSIDIDVFFPTHKYGKYISSELSHEMSWDLINVRTRGEEFPINEKALDWTLNLLDNVVTMYTEVIVMQEHNEMDDFFKAREIKDCHCVNVDAHHDISYHGDNSVVNIENWVLFGKFDGHIDTYRWIHHEASDMCGDSPFKYEHDAYSDADINTFEKVDYLLICVSKHFTPIEHHGLATKLERYAEDIKLK